MGEVVQNSSEDSNEEIHNIEISKNYGVGDFVSVVTNLGDTLRGEVLKICEIMGTPAMLIRDFDLAVTDPIKGAMLVRGERYILHPEKNNTLRKLTNNEVGHEKDNYNRRNDVKLSKYYDSEIYLELNKLDLACKDSQDTIARTYVVTIMSNLERLREISGVTKEFLLARDEIGHSFIDILNVLKLDTSGEYLQNKIIEALATLKVLNFKPQISIVISNRQLQTHHVVKAEEGIEQLEA